METTVTVQEALVLYQNNFISEEDFNRFMNIKADEVRKVVNAKKDATSILDSPDVIPEDIEFDDEPLGPVLK